MLRSFNRIRRLPTASRHRSLATARELLLIEPSVQEALSNAKPVVALESTIVAHGMPYPQNLHLAREVEAILRSKVRTTILRICFIRFFNSYTDVQPYLILIVL
jgi:hypothetical protein